MCVAHEDIVGLHVQVHYRLAVEISNCGAQLALHSALQANAVIDLALAQVVEGVCEAAARTAFLRTMS